MMIFKYSAINRAGKTQTGRIDAVNTSDFLEKIRNKGLTPTSYSQVKINNLKLKKSTRDQEISLRILKSISLLIGVNVPIIDSLMTVQREEGSRQGRKDLQTVVAHLKEGDRLSAALAETRIFSDPFLIGIVRAGELSASLMTALQDFITLREKEIEFSKSVRSSFYYPGFILLTSFLMLILIVKFVFPPIINILIQSGSDLPFLLLAYVEYERFTSEWSSFYLNPAFLCLFFISFYFLRAQSRNLFMKTPFIGSLLQSQGVVQFLSSLHLMLKNNVTLTDALIVLSETADSAELRYASTDALLRLREGAKFSDTIGDCYIFSETTRSVLRTNEKSKTLVLSLEGVVHIEIEKRNILMKNISKIIPPLLMLLVGGFVSLLVMTLVEAMMSVNDAIAF